MAVLAFVVLALACLFVSFVAPFVRRAIRLAIRLIIDAIVVIVGEVLVTKEEIRDRVKHYKVARTENLRASERRSANRQSVALICS